MQQIEVGIIPEDTAFTFTKGFHTVRLYITNNDKNDDPNNPYFKIYTGRNFYMEYFNKTQWERIPVDWNFEDSAQKIFPLSSWIEDIVLNKSDYDYPPGRYRIVKDICILRPKAKQPRYCFEGYGYFTILPCYQNVRI